tara:strand:+ start:3258 stop:3428 length:171 start_codon:yes stop_codon:yes gene_type:complete
MMLNLILALLLMLGIKNIIGYIYFYRFLGYLNSSLIEEEENILKINSPHLKLMSQS